MQNYEQHKIKKDCQPKQQQQKHFKTKNIEICKCPNFIDNLQITGCIFWYTPPNLRSTNLKYDGDDVTSGVAMVLVVLPGF